MRTKPVLFACCLLMTVMMLPGCSGCWKKPELQVVNPTRYLEVQDGKQEEIWELIRIKGDVAGYQHTVMTRLTKDGETIYQVTQENLISANRLGVPMIGRIEMIVQQKRDGTFLLGDKTESLSGQSMVTMFRPDEASSTMLRQAGTWAINPETGNDEPNADPRDKTLPWKPGTLGQFGKQFSLWEKPLASGEQRTIEYFDLMLEQIVTVELTAGKVESLLYNNRETHLLPVAETTRIGNSEIVSQFWMDANGNIIRTTMNNPIPMEIALSTQEKAMSAKENAGRVNLNLFALVRVRGTIPQPRMSQKVEFRLHRINLDEQSGLKPAFADFFPTTAFQTVNVVDENTLDVTVTASSPTALTALTGSVIPSAAKETTVPADLQRNEWIQSDSVQITQLAAEASQSASRSWEVAAELESYVSQKLQQVSYQQASASAAEVAETLQGDSAGYAMLLAAIARVKGIPARVVAGLVYTDTNTNEGVMVLHFWTEMSIDGHWHSFDATIGQGGADASRIALAHSNLSDESLSALVAKILPLIGHLQVTILAASDW
jgi:hypothetical protein